MNDSTYDDYPDPEPDFEWHDGDEDPAPPPRRARSRASGSRSSSRSGRRGRRGGRGGGLSIPPPSTRLLGIVVAAIALAVVVTLVVRDCQRDQLVDSYKTYVADATVIVDDSAEQGNLLRSILNNNQSQDANQLQTRVKQLANQSQALVDRADALSPPGKLKAAHRSLVTALEFRTGSLNGLAADLPEIIRSDQANFGATQLATRMQRFLASDVIYIDSFVGPADLALSEDNISGVEVPRGDDARFLPGNTTSFASPSGAQSMIPNLKSGTTAQSGNAGGSDTDDDQTGALRGLELISVEALPSGQTLSTSTETAVDNSGLIWRVTVENGGDFDESGVNVVVTLSYDDNPADTWSLTRAIDFIQSKQQTTLDFSQGGEPRLGESGRLSVEVEPVENETTTANNSAGYPVKITVAE